MSLTAALYARQSKDDQARSGKSTRDQLADARAEAERRGWSVVGEFEDVDIGASRHSRARTRWGFNALTSSISNGSVQAVVVAEVSRLSRRQSELWTLVEACADAQVVLVIGGREVDPNDPGDVIQTAVMGGLATAEVEQLRRRVTRGTRHAALEGRPHGRRVYGYRRVYDQTTKALVRVEPEPAEAVVVRRVVDALLSGKSLRSVTKSLNEEGITTGTGKAWEPRSVKRLALSPTYLGIRVHRPKDGGAPTESQGQWPALVTKAEHARLRAMLEDASRGTFRGREQVHWLSGVVTCGVCGSTMRVLKRRNGGLGYTCSGGHCTAITKASLETFVEEVILLRLSQPDARETLTPRTNTHEYERLRGEVSDVDRRLEDLVEEYAKGTLSAQTLGRAEQRLLETREGLINRLEAIQPRSLPDGLLVDPGATWARLSAEQRRTVATALFDEVSVNQVGKGKWNVAASDRVNLIWRGGCT